MVDDEFKVGSRFLPARVVVVFSDLMKPKNQIVKGPHPFRRINHAGLQAREDLTTGNIDRRPAGGFKYFAPQAGNPHLDPLKIAEAINFFVKPARHLRARITA